MMTRYIRTAALAFVPMYLFFWFFLRFSVVASVDATGAQSKNATAPAKLLSDLAERLHNHVQTLALGIGPRSCTDGGNLDKAANYIRDQLTRSGFSTIDTASYDAECLPPRVFTFQNLGVEIKSGDSTIKPIVVGAHYDTCTPGQDWPTCSRGTPGADDNASGVAVVLELASRFRTYKSDVPIHFVFFSSEEEPFFSGRTGDMGSARYADTHPVKAMFSVESVGFMPDSWGSATRLPGLVFPGVLPARGSFVIVTGRSQDATQVASLTNSIGAFYSTVGLTLDAGLADWSDHKSFHLRNPNQVALMITDSPSVRNGRYHTQSDTPNTLNYDAMARVMLGIEKELLRLAPLKDAKQEGVARAN